MTQSSTQRTALVLAGGGSLGAVQVGMLAELIGAGIAPDLIVGVSAGALNGAFLAHDPCLATVERMALLWSRMTTREVLGHRILSNFKARAQKVGPFDLVERLLKDVSK